METNDKYKIEQSSRNSRKARRERCKVAQKLHKEREKLDKEVVEKQNERKCREGSIFAGQVVEPLRSMLDGFKARLKPNQTLKERIRSYPNP